MVAKTRYRPHFISVLLIWKQIFDTKAEREEKEGSFELKPKEQQKKKAAGLFQQLNFSVSFVEEVTRSSVLQ